MTRDFIHINDFIILVEEASSKKIENDICRFEEPLIAVAFYGSGNVDLSVKYGQKKKDFHHTKGLTLSFYADEHVEFEHTIAPDKNLECIVVATALRNIEQLPNQEGEIFMELLQELVHPKAYYVEGNAFSCLSQWNESLMCSLRTKIAKNIQLRKGMYKLRREVSNSIDSFRIGKTP